MTQTETPVQVNVIQYAELGLCRADLLRVVEGRDVRWMIFFHTPTGTRIDTLSRILRKMGGHFGSLDNHLGLVYRAQCEACEAFGLLIDTIRIEAGGTESVLN